MVVGLISSALLEFVVVLGRGLLETISGGASYQIGSFPKFPADLPRDLTLAPSALWESIGCLGSALTTNPRTVLHSASLIDFCKKNISQLLLFRPV